MGKAGRGAGGRQRLQPKPGAHLAVARHHAGLFLLAAFAALAILLAAIAEAFACARAHHLDVAAQHWSREAVWTTCEASRMPTRKGDEAMAAEESSGLQAAVPGWQRRQTEGDEPLSCRKAEEVMGGMLPNHAHAVFARVHEAYAATSAAVRPSL